MERSVHGIMHGEDFSQFLDHKADLGCSRCMFMAERGPTKKGASGKMTAQSRTHAQVLDQAYGIQVSQLTSGSKREMVFVSVSWFVYHTLIWLECRSYVHISSWNGSE